MLILETGIDKVKFVSAIQKGLSNTQVEIYSSNTITDNRKHMEKWDKINTCLNDLFNDNNRFSVVPLDRGLFKLVMIFDNVEQVLYTVIKKNNFNKLLSRKFLPKAHYIDAMLDYNYHYQEVPLQMSLFDMDSMFSETAEKQISDLHISIESLLSTDKVKKYITIVIDFTGYTLNAVEAVFCSKWLETIESENWSEYIVPSFDDIEDNGKNDYVHENELKLKIALKPTIKKAQNIG